MTEQLSRRAFFEAYGRWPKPDDLRPEAPTAARYSVTFTRAAPAVPPKSPERTAWENAYSGPEVGPQGGSWPEDATGYSRFMVWKLPYNSGSSRPTSPRN
jgi:hypothetical protein